MLRALNSHAPFLPCSMPEAQHDTSQADSSGAGELSIEDRAGLHCLDDAFRFVAMNFDNPAALELIGAMQAKILYFALRRVSVITDTEHVTILEPSIYI